MAFSPRKKAKSLIPRINYWRNIEQDGPVLLGFAGYKAGMTGILYIENNQNSINYGKEVYTAVTIVETPPLHAVGLIGYHASDDGESLATFGCALDCT